MTCPTCHGHGLDSCVRRDCPVRAWWLEFDVQGEPWYWRGNAASERIAEQRAREEIARRGDLSPTAARLVACLER